MKTLFAALLAISLCFLVACGHTPQKKAVETLTSIGLAANQAYEGYLMSVFQGVARTNEVPTITGYYRAFQASFGVAASAARFSTNATPANPELLQLANQLTVAISKAKSIPNHH